MRRVRQLRSGSTMGLAYSVFPESIGKAAPWFGTHGHGAIARLLLERIADISMIRKLLCSRQCTGLLIRLMT